MRGPAGSSRVWLRNISGDRAGQEPDPGREAGGNGRDDSRDDAHDIRPPKVTAEDFQDVIEDGKKSQKAAGVLRNRFQQAVDDLLNFPNAFRAVLEQDVKMLKTLLPGLDLNRASSTSTLPAIIVSGVAWLCIYFKYVYTSDHDAFLSGWENAEEARRVEREQSTTNSAKCRPDIVFVFHHPEYLYSDSKDLVTKSKLDQVLLRHKSRPHGDMKQAVGRFSALQEIWEDSELLTDRSLTVRLNTTMEEGRYALMRDMFDTLPKRMGFKLEIFSSIDSDELYVCVCLHQPHIIDYYMESQNKELQVTHDVVRALKIDQDPADPASSPPYVRHDRRIVRHLASAEVIERPDEKLLYRTFYDRGSEGCVVSSAEKIRVILRELSTCLDIEAAKALGLILDWYPVHSELWLRKLKETWLQAGVHNNFKQPVALLKEYFGAQIGFSFAWQGLYCRCLLALAVIAVVLEVMKKLPHLFVSTKLVRERQMLPFAILLMIWARIAYNLWDREEMYFITLWEYQYGITDHIPRPSFVGQLQASVVDKKILEEVLPENQKALLRVTSMIVTLACCLFTMFLISAWVHVHEGHLDTVASIWLSVLVKSSELSYNILSAKLAEWENHKYEDTFHDSWVWQQFLFQAVNSYWACVSIALTQLWTSNCPEVGCYYGLKRQMGLLMVILLSCSMVFILLEVVVVKYSLFREDREMEKRLGVEEARQKKAERSFLEEQSKFSAFGIKEQIENMLQLVLGLGFVLLFGALQPLVVPLCLLHFAITLQARAVLLTTYTKRCVPHMLIGIGAWKPVVALLMNVSVFVNGFLLVYWGVFFQGGNIVAKLAGMIFWVMLVYSTWALVDILVPRSSKKADTMSLRRKHVRRSIAETTMQEQAARDKAREEIVAAMNAAVAMGTPRSTMTAELPGSPEVGPIARSQTAGDVPGSTGPRPQPEKITRAISDSITNRTVLVQIDPKDDREQKFYTRIVNKEDWNQVTTLKGMRKQIPPDIATSSTSRLKHRGGATFF